MTDDQQLLKAIEQVRRDIADLGERLELAGLVRPQFPEVASRIPPWKPPAIKRLGDMLQIIGRADPATAAAFEQQGFDAEQDVAVDPEADPGDTDNKKHGRDADGGPDPDPTKRDNDPNPRDLRPEWLGGDADPTQRDAAMNPRDPAPDIKADPDVPNVRDDQNPTEPRPDTSADSPT